MEFLLGSEELDEFLGMVQESRDPAVDLCMLWVVELRDCEEVAE